MFTTHHKRARFWCISLLLNSTVFPKNCCFHTPSQNLNKGKCSLTSGSRAFALHWCIAPGIKPYQFVWTLIIWWCFGWEYFQTQIIYQCKSTLYRGHIRAICSKFIIINRLGSCRKLYNCKSFQKNVPMLISGLFDPETKGNHDLAGYSLTNKDFCFS